MPTLKKQRLPRVRGAASRGAVYVVNKHKSNKRMNKAQKWERAEGHYRTYKKVRVDLRKAESLGFSLYGAWHKHRGKKLGMYDASGRKKNQRRRPKGTPLGGQYY